MVTIVASSGLASSGAVPSLGGLLRGALALGPITVGALGAAGAVREAGGDRRDLVVALAALLALATYLLVLPTGDHAELVLSAGVAAALWLHARIEGSAREGDPHARRLLPLWLLIAGCLGGSRPALVLPLAVLGASPCRALVRGSGSGARAWARVVLVAGLGALVGRGFLAVPASSHGVGVAALLRWWAGAVREAGVPTIALAALAAVSIALGPGLLGPAPRRLAIAAALLVALDARAGHASPLTALALALGLGLGLADTASRLRAPRPADAVAGVGPRPLPGVALLLVPLAVLALVEPFALRLRAAHLGAPALGPLPPSGTARPPLR